MRYYLKSKQQKQKEGSSYPRPDLNLLRTSGSIGLIEPYAHSFRLQASPDVGMGDIEPCQSRPCRGVIGKRGLCHRWQFHPAIQRPIRPY